MGVQSKVVYENVIKEYQYELPQVRTKDGVNETLESKRGILKDRKALPRIRSGLHGCGRLSSVHLPGVFEFDGIPTAKFSLEK